jgi:lipopolysaccharide cholinephosphotransferase
MTQNDVNEIQRIDTELLQNVKQICDRHNIEYFLVYGTLLGAVRHGGPIPWDDDIDIGMTRDNYMKFLEIAAEELDPRNQINIMGSGVTKYLSELKIGRKNTWFYLEGTRNLDIMRQIQLDIFMFDYIKPLKPKQKRRCELVRKILYISKLSWDEKRLIIMCTEKNRRVNKALRAVVLTLAHSIRLVFGEARLEKFIYKMLVDETRTSGQMGIVYLGGKIRTWPAESFLSLTPMDYAGLSVSVPACYDKLLTDIYGDYMKLPPEDKRYRKNFDRFVVEIEE